MKLGELLIKLRAEESLRDAAKRIGISSTVGKKGTDSRTNQTPKPIPAVLMKIAWSLYEVN